MGASGAGKSTFLNCISFIDTPSKGSVKIQGVDLLFHEATFVNSDSARARQTQHSTAQQAAQIARDAQVKRLVIGHFSARYDDEQELLKEAQAVFPNTILAQENLQLTI